MHWDWLWRRLLGAPWLRGRDNDGPLEERDVRNERGLEVRPIHQTPVVGLGMGRMEGAMDEGEQLDGRFLLGTKTGS